MKNSSITTPVNFPNELTSLRRTKRFEQNSKDHEVSQKEFDQIEQDYFDLLKNLTILSGTVFASSIALAAGNEINFLFFAGELCLFVSTLVGIIFLWSQLKGREWFHFLMAKGRMESDLNINKDIMDDFEKKIVTDMIATHKKLIDKKGVLYPFLRVIKIDWIPSIFFTFLILGLLLILLSLFPSNIVDWNVVSANLPTIRRFNMDDKLLFTLSALFSLIGGLSFGKGLFISKKQAIELGVSRWSGDTDEENLTLPAVRDRLEQKKWGIIGATFTVIAFILQVVGLYLS